MKVIVTGATGMVGEGVLLSCLEDPEVSAVLSVSRRSCGHTHPKLRELLLPDFRDAAAHAEALTGYDACFYAAGISSVGMNEADYTVITYDTPVAFAEVLHRQNPEMVLVHVSGRSTDSTEQGRVMWARVKGKAENALMRMPFKAVYNVRPALLKPVPGQRHVKAAFRAALVLYPLLALLFPAMSLRDVARALIHCVRFGSGKHVLEVEEMRAMAARTA